MEDRYAVEGLTLIEPRRRNRWLWTSGTVLSHLPGRAFVVPIGLWRCLVLNGTFVDLLFGVLTGGIVERFTTRVRLNLRDSQCTRL
jgi:hypothetical protein